MDAAMKVLVHETAMVLIQLYKQYNDVQDKALPSSRR